MEQIYNNIKLSSDICGVIYKYIDYTTDNLYELYYKNYNVAPYKNLPKNITLIDLIVKAIHIGHKGFFYKKSHKNFCEQMEKIIQKNEYQDIIIKKDHSTVFIVHMIGDKYNNCDIGLIL